MRLRVRINYIQQNRLGTKRFLFTLSLLGSAFGTQLSVRLGFSKLPCQQALKDRVRGPWLEVEQAVLSFCRLASDQPISFGSCFPGMVLFPSVPS